MKEIIKRFIEEEIVTCDICQKQDNDSCQCGLCGKDLCKNCVQVIIFSPNIFYTPLPIHLCKDCVANKLDFLIRIYKEQANEK